MLVVKVSARANRRISFRFRMCPSIRLRALLKLMAATCPFVGGQDYNGMPNDSSSHPEWNSLLTSYPRSEVAMFEREAASRTGSVATEVTGEAVVGLLVDV
jgi:hypothetical protein